MSRSDVACACGCGTVIQSPDARGRQRRFSRGHNLRVDHPLNRPGVENWWRGREHTPETRVAISEKASRPKPWLRGERNGMAGRTGPLNPNWKGGVAPERQRLYSTGEWKSVARSVRRRDGNRCTSCGNVEPRLHVHHIRSFADHPELRLELDNLTTLCRSCHAEAHRKGGGE